MPSAPASICRARSAVSAERAADLASASAPAARGRSASGSRRARARRAGRSSRARTRSRCRRAPARRRARRPGRRAGRRRSTALVRAERLLDARAAALGRQQALDLRPREPGRRASCSSVGSAPCVLQVLARARSDLREPADRAVRERHRPRQLGHELLHRLAHPEGRVRPERRAELRVVAARGEQQPGHTVLDQLLALDPAPVETGARARDRRQERLDEPPARVGSPPSAAMTSSRSCERSVVAVLSRAPLVRRDSRMLVGFRRRRLIGGLARVDVGPAGVAVGPAYRYWGGHCPCCKAGTGSARLWTGFWRTPGSVRAGRRPAGRGRRREDRAAGTPAAAADGCHVAARSASSPRWSSPSAGCTSSARRFWTRLERLPAPQRIALETVLRPQRRPGARPLPRRARCRSLLADAAEQPATAVRRRRRALAGRGLSAGPCLRRAPAAGRAIAIVFGVRPEGIGEHALAGLPELADLGPRRGDLRALLLTHMPPARRRRPAPDRRGGQAIRWPCSSFRVPGTCRLLAGGFGLPEIQPDPRGDRAELRRPAARLPRRDAAADPRRGRRASRRSAAAPARGRALGLA